MIRTKPQIAALMVMAVTMGPGCKKEDCLNQSYDATVQVVQDFSAGRCRAVFKEDWRDFDCPAGNLTGEVNGRRFELTLNAQEIEYKFTREGLQARCGRMHAELVDREILSILESRFKEALAELEVD